MIRRVFRPGRVYGKKRNLKSTSSKNKTQSKKNLKVIQFHISKFQVRNRFELQKTQIIKKYQLPLLFLPVEYGLNIGIKDLVVVKDLDIRISEFQKNLVTQFIGQTRGSYAQSLG